MKTNAVLSALFSFAIVFIHPTALGKWQSPAEKYLDAHKAYDSAKCPITASTIKHFVYFARDRQQIKGHALLGHSAFAGAQIMYPWVNLEPTQDVYDFSQIKQDLAYLARHNKKLFIQLQDATFYEGSSAVPDYLRHETFDGGIAVQVSESGKPEGTVAKRWNAKVQRRFALLLKALGETFDGKVAGVNLQETAINIREQGNPNFNHKAYVEGIKANMLALKKAFPESVTLQYANFMPGEWLPWEDEGYLQSIYSYGEKIGVGLGGPDLMMTRKAQLNHTIAMMHENDYNVPLAIAVQDGNYIGHTGADGAIVNKTKKRRNNLVPKLHDFAQDFMGVDYIFWSNQEPYIKEDVLPCFQALQQ